MTIKKRKSNRLPGKLICFSFFLYQLSFAQVKSISITIDDVPNTVKFLEDGSKPLLLNLLDSLNIPFTVFINENKIYGTRNVSLNKKLLESWIKHKQALIANHSYSHPRYSDTGLDKFSEDVLKGEKLSKNYGQKYEKKLKYFRFPYNDLGKDSLQHIEIRNFLKSKGYLIAPFTIESSDWMYNYIYRYYLRNGYREKAREIGENYVKKTLELLQFYEKMAFSLYKRHVKQIYLCHDNAINTDYLDKIIRGFRASGYKIIGFKESLRDPVYKQKDRYHKKWGISWLYRWMNSQKERIKWMKKEPPLADIETVYQEILKQRSHNK